MRTHDYILVGGGIVGACLAEELARTGASVAVMDAGQEAGHATRKAAGVAVPSLRYLDRTAFYQWLCTGRDRLEQDISRLQPEHGGFSVASPILRALRTVDVDAYGDRLNAAGAGRWVDSADLPTVAPGMKLPADRHYLLDPHGLMVDGGRYLLAVRSQCLAAGVAWHQNTTVRSLTESASGVEAVTDNGTFHADRAILTTGAWTGGPLGPGLPVFPQRGQLVQLETAEKLPCIFSSAFYLAPGVDGRVIVGATEEDAGFDERCTAGGIGRLLMFAGAALPALADAAPAELRAGLRPATRSGFPLAGRIPGRTRTYVAAGHAGHGLLSARISAEGMKAGLTADDWDALPEEFCPTVGERGRAA
ncbi:NAD(P)/FAD-dependent oxidoreductase [Streptomyces parvus]|uniref:FAD-binding oxidoreductase n=1 Tax=Streptomyces parvus TaxID=66428 RepID=A0A5D4JC11_9ACTN|nr:FAD-dependent oxidoreductase [Streptomyces parvus]TYR62718.1 FAD-binding oxidoreductase [Streptomyces parvus]